MKPHDGEGIKNLMRLQKTILPQCVSSQEALKKSAGKKGNIQEKGDITNEDFIHFLSSCCVQGSQFQGQN